MTSASLSAPDGRSTDADGDQAAPDDLIGRVIADKFRVEGLIGSGAMGRVYRAQHVALDRSVAIKVLHKHLGGDERVAKRFHREARAASRLSHPNSLQIIDFGRTKDGILFIAMELLDGEDLQTVLDHDAPLSPERIVALLCPVLRALEEAHRAGIVHRDLKPENVVVLSDRSGREHVKVCDFGIAKILDAEKGPSITVDGFVCGTPQYMSPEQARGDDIDHRSDIYAAGCVLYQMLVGRVPFNAESALGVITKHLTQDVEPPRQRRPELGIPAALEAVCLRAMQKDPGARYQTAAEMADALQAALTSLGGDADARLGTGPFKHDEPSAASAPGAASEPTGASSRGPALAAASVALLLAGLALAFFFGGAGRPAVSEVEPTPSPSTPAGAPAEARGPQSAPPALPEIDEEAPQLPEEPLAEVITTPEPEAARPSRRERRPSAEVSPTPPAPSLAVAAEATSRSAGELAFDEGRRLFLANDVTGAIRAFEEAARLTPRSAEVHKQLGRAYMRQGDVSRAVASYRRYLELRPEAPDRAIVERIIAGGG